jgi:hypothetical protein
LFINYDGAVKPSCECVEEAGNVLHHPVNELWNGTVMKKYREKMMQGTIDGWCRKECVRGMMKESWLVER